MMIKNLATSINYLAAVTPPRLMFVGDPHGRFEPILAAIETLRPTAVVLLGDYELKAPLDHVMAPVLEQTEVWWIPGNHDFDHQSYYNHLFKNSLRDRNLHGRVVEVAGYRIAGLGGHFQEKVWDPNREKVHYQSRQEFLSTCGKGNFWEGGLPLKRRGAIWPEDIKTLRTQKADILATHEAPSCHPYGFAVLDTLAAAMGAGYIVHGHQHQTYHAEVNAGRTQVVGLDTGSCWLFP